MKTMEAAGTTATTSFVISYTEETEVVNIIRDALSVSGERFAEVSTKRREHLFFGKTVTQNTIMFKLSDRTRISNFLSLIGEREGKDLYSVVLP